MFGAKHVQPNKPSIGKIGEDFVAEFLAELGWQVIARNVGLKIGEIDIVARDTEDTLVFVEVKTLKGHSPELGLIPEDNLTHEKLRKMRRMAEWFTNRNPQLIHRAGWRIDLIAVTILTDKEKDFRINHYQNL